MKYKYLGYLGIALLSFHISSCIYDWAGSVTGNGNVVSDLRPARSFTSIDVSGGLYVFVTFGNSPGIEVVADENLQEVILTEIRGNTLVIKPEVSIRGASSKKIFLNVQSLQHIGISSAADVKGQNRLETDNLRIDISSAGQLDIDVAADKTIIDISSSGDVIISGHTEFLRANVSSAGGLDAKDLIAEEADVNASSAGSAVVQAKERLIADASSGGRISYYGDTARKNITTPSGGSIRRKD